MAKMKVPPLGRRIMALFLTALMCVSLIQITAFAAENQTSAQQIKQDSSGNYLYQEYDPATGDTTGKDVTDPENSSPKQKVKVSKTIAPTGTENEFDVTLQVKTKQEAKSVLTNSDAAVTLVIDVSGSMKSKRLDSAKKTALSFLKDYAASANGAKRMVSIVTFSSGSQAVQIGGRYWVDAATMDWTDGTANDLKTAINGLSADGGTNMDAGLRVAYNLLKQETTAGIDNRTCIFLTDGEPTFYYSKTAFAEDPHTAMSYETGKYLVNIAGYKLYENIQGYGDAADEDTKQAAETVADAIRGLKSSTPKQAAVNLYSVYYGKHGDKMHDDIVDEWRTPIQPWLTSISSTAAYTADNAEALQANFKSILDMITMMTNAWEVTDPMAQSISLVHTENDGIVDGGTNQEKTYDSTTHTLTWRLQKNTQHPENGGYFVYTMTYRIRLDNTGGINGYVPTNGKTSLTYNFTKSDNGGDPYFVNEDGDPVYDAQTHEVNPGMEKWTKNQVIYFNVPQVCSYLGGFTFQKRASGDETGAQATVLFTTGNHSATFTLYSDADCTTLVQAASTIGNQVTFSGIPSGTAYYMKETSAPEGFQKDTNVYTVSVAYGVTTVSLGDQILYKSGTADTMTVVEKYDARKVPVTVKKTWQDGDSASRPDITVNIWKQNGARDDAEPTAHKLTALFASDPKDEEVLTLTLKDSNVTKNGNVWTLNSGKELPSVDETTGKQMITYYATEDAVNGYESSSVGFEYTVSNSTATAATVTATNTRTGTHNITVNKVWVAPKAESQAEIQVLQNRTTVYQTVTLNAGNNWTDTLKDVPTYDSTGKKYFYSVHEVNETDGTVTYGTGDKATTYSVGYSGFTVTNTIPQSAVTINGTKVWKDGSSASRAPVTMELYADGHATGITAAADGTANSQPYSFSKDGKDDLPKYALTNQVGSAAITKDGHEIVYTVKETTALGGDYQTAETGTSANNYMITNQLAGTTSVYVEKLWDVPEGFFGTTTNAETHETTANAYPSVTLKLYRDGTATDNTVTLNGQDDQWKHTFSDLDKYDENGNPYTYTVKEQSGDSYTNNGAVTVGGEAMTVTLKGSGTADGPYILTNSAVGTTSVTGTKTWVDGGNALNTRPASVTLQLVRDGQNVDGEVVALTSSNAAAGNSNVWNYTFADLPAYNGSTPYTYTVREVSPDSKYDVSYSSDTLNITNTIKQEKVAVYGEKVWVDGGNAQNTRQAAVIHLMNGDKRVDTKTIQATATGDALKFSFTDLDKFDASGAVIAYTLTEDAVNGYTTSLTQKGDLTANSSTADNPFIITNTYVIPTTQVAVSKTWVDGGKDHSNDSVTVQLLCNGSAIKGKTCALTAENSWTDTAAFVSLPTLSSDYKTSYTYTVEETDISAIDSEKPISKLSDYTVTYSGGAITNTLTAIETAKTNFEVYKNWIGPVPKEVASVTAVLGRKVNGNEDTDWTENVTVSKHADGSWSGKAADLNTLNKDGYAYTYFIKAEQDAVTADQTATYTIGGHTYDVNLDGHTITNTIRQEKVTVQGTKSWTGDTSEKSVQVQLTLGDQKIGDTLTVSKDTDWKYTWKDLDAYTFVKDADGKVTSATANDYRVEEIGAKSNGDGTAAVQYGENHYTVKYTTGKDGSQNIENAWTSTDTYAYQIDRVYNYYQDGILNNTINKAGIAVSTSKNAPVSVDTASYPATDSMTGYTLVGATLKKNTADAAAETQTVGKDGKFNFNVTDPNVTYVVTLTYEIRQTTPYIPPNPGPNPPVVIPNQPTEPPVKIPDTNPPTTDIPDGNTPTAEKPTPATPGKPTSEIPEGRTPLASAPRTGDALAAWLTAAIVSGAGLAWLAISAKKRREENAQ